MNVTQDTPDLLIIEHVPWVALAWILAFMSIWVAGAVAFILEGMVGGAVVFLGLGTILPMAIIWGTMARSQLVFDRAANTVEHRRRSFRGYTRQSLSLSDVERFYVGLNGLKRGRIFMKVPAGMDAGHHVFPHEHVPLERIEIAISAITAWRSQ